MANGFSLPSMTVGAVLASKVSAKAGPEEFQALWDKAVAAGMAAGKEVVPVPMYVSERVNPLNDNSPVKTAYAPVLDGVCGFAWVKLRPATSSFAKWLRKTGKARPSYYGGLEVGTSALFGQSMTRKEAFAQAMASVFQAAGYEAYADSRMD